MNNLVGFIAFSVFFVLGATTVLAYNPTINPTIVPYEVYAMDSNIKAKAEYLGKLTGDPQMYEFSLGADTDLKLQVVQLTANPPVPFSLIVVKRNSQNAGVVEVGRLRAKDTEWEIFKDSVLGLPLLQSSVFEAKIGAGTYRVEVSTPDNFGLYMLKIGDEDVKRGYFNTLADIRTIQKFFDKSILSMLKSSYVYYPLGIIFLLGLFFFTWRNRKSIQEKYA